MPEEEKCRMSDNSTLFSEAQAWLDEDLNRIKNALGDRIKALQGKRILVTGAAGFLGFGFLHFFSCLNRSFLKHDQLSIVAADNYIRGCPRWLIELATASPHIKLVRKDITEP